MIPTLEWTPEGVSFLDQTKLPHEETYVLARDYNEVARVIRDMIVRGAMAIGVSAAMGVALGIDRSLSHTPLFQTVFVLQNAPRHALKLQDLDVEYLPINTNTAKYDLNLTMQESPDGLMTWFEYNADLFDAATIQRMMAHLETLLVGVVANPDGKVSQLPLIGADELKAFVTPAADAQHGTATSITEWFESQAADNPDLPALSFENTTLSYAELNRRTNQLAHHLIKLGVGPNQLSICPPRSPRS